MNHNSPNLIPTYQSQVLNISQKTHVTLISSHGFSKQIFLKDGNNDVFKIFEVYKLLLVRVLVN